MVSVRVVASRSICMSINTMIIFGKLRAWSFDDEMVRRRSRGLNVMQNFCKGSWRMSE